METLEEQEAQEKYEEEYYHRMNQAREKELQDKKIKKECVK